MGVGSPPAKRARAGRSAPELTQGSTFVVNGLFLTDYSIQVPLDYSDPSSSASIEVFFRVATHRNKREDRSLPYLVYFQGGPGFASPRPCESSGWLKQAAGYFHVVLLDQRGTGRSTPITCENVFARAGSRDPEAVAAYLSHFRADSIVWDAERVRKALVPRDVHEGRWSALGQSFGGFCCFTYLSLASEGLVEALVAAGVPPRVAEADAAPAVYARTLERVATQNARFYERFPEDARTAIEIVRHLQDRIDAGDPETTPAGVRISPDAFLSVGCQGLGFSLGFERLHYLLENRQLDAWLPWEGAPLYALLHEAIYLQGACPGGSRWAAARALEADARFDAVARARAGQRVLFTGECALPWIFRDVPRMRALRPVAEALARREAWSALYDAAALRRNAVPVAALVAFEDMFVDSTLALETVGAVGNARAWVTNEFLHCAIREAGGAVFERLLNLARGGLVLR